MMVRVNETEDGRFTIVDENGKPVPGKDGEVPVMRFRETAQLIAAAMNSKRTKEQR